MRVRYYRRLFSTLAVSPAIEGWAFSPRPATARQPHMSSTSLSSTSLLSSQLCLGGDFAGLQAKFSASDGTLVPIPEHWIPESLLEWGQEPSALEVLSSEEFASGQRVQRQEITVLPAVGCAIDNLETMKSEIRFDQEEQAVWSHPSESTLVLDATLPGKSNDDATIIIRRVETHFALADSHRVRVSLDLKIQEKSSYEIQSPIVLYLERQTNTTSSQGTRADGGGLDGRTVSSLLGDWLWKSPSFAEKKPLQWKVKQQQEFTPSSSIHLPGNITIASGPDKEGTWCLELSHFTEEDSSRRIVQRKYNGLQCEATYKEENVDYDKASIE